MRKYPYITTKNTIFLFMSDWILWKRPRGVKEFPSGVYESGHALKKKCHFFAHSGRVHFIELGVSDIVKLGSTVNQSLNEDVNGWQVFLW